MRIVEDSSTDLAYGFIKGGYFNYSSWNFVCITIMNAVLAFLFLTAASPLFLLITIIHKMNDGGPVFYKGVRLGLTKNPFYMYKFRTLPIGAQKVIGTEELGVEHQQKLQVSPFAKFLRDTRLDELPQLINILKGEMDFIGPRPIRPEVYDAHAQGIKDFDKRFTVRPGLIGYAQLFTPHGSPKRLRSLIDNRFIRTRRSILWDLILIGYTILIVLKETLIRGTRLFWKEGIKRRIMRMYIEMRALERIRTPGMKLTFNSGLPSNAKVKLFDINEFYFRMHSSHPLGEGEHEFLLNANVKKFGQETKKKRFKGKAEPYKQIDIPAKEYKYCYIMSYEPASPFNKYIRDQYILKHSII